VTDERPMRADARRNRERLMSAALEAYSEHGEKASMDEIAKRAGVGPGTLYRHFPTREALLADVYRDGVDGIVARAQELAGVGEPMASLRTFLHEQLDWHQQRHGLGVAVKTMLTSDSEVLSHCRSALYGSLGALLRRAQDAGAVRTDVDAPQVLRLVHGITLGSSAAPAEAHVLLDIVIDGLRAPVRS
jgi:AcrR family transcriptional regulator